MIDGPSGSCGRTGCHFIEQTEDVYNDWYMTDAIDSRPKDLEEAECDQKPQVRSCWEICLALPMLIYDFVVSLIKYIIFRCSTIGASTPEEEEVDLIEGDSSVTKGLLITRSIEIKQQSANSTELRASLFVRAYLGWMSMAQEEISKAVVEKAQDIYHTRIVSSLEGRCVTITLGTVDDDGVTKKATLVVKANDNEIYAEEFNPSRPITWSVDGICKRFQAGGAISLPFANGSWGDKGQDELALSTEYHSVDFMDIEKRVTGSGKDKKSVFIQGLLKALDLQESDIDYSKVERLFKIVAALNPMSRTVEMSIESKKLILKVRGSDLLYKERGKVFAATGQDTFSTGDAIGFLNRKVCTLHHARVREVRKCDLDEDLLDVTLVADLGLGVNFLRRSDD